MRDFNYIILSLGLIILTNLLLLVKGSARKTTSQIVSWPIHARILLNVGFAPVVAVSVLYFRPMFIPVLVIFTICQITLTILTYKFPRGKLDGTVEPTAEKTSGQSDAP